MKKLVTALIIVLPLIFVVAIFAITSVARISANIPATGIEIGNRGDDGNGTFWFDLADYGEENRLYEDELGIQVLPAVAKNRNFYLMSVNDSETGKPSNAVTVEEDANGRKFFDLKNIGKVKLTYASSDGAHQASVQFVISASDVIGITPVLRDREDNLVALEKSDVDGIDFVARIKSGDYSLGATPFPDVPASRAEYLSSDPTRLEINEVSGSLSARFSGTVTVTQTIGKAAPVKILFEVERAGEVTVNGRNVLSSPRLRAPLNSTMFSLYVEADDQDISLSAQDGGVSDVTVSNVQGVDNAYKLDVRLSAPYAEERSVRYYLTVGQATYEFIVDFAAYDFKIFSADNSADEEELLTLLGDTTSFAITVEPQNANISYEWSVISDGEPVARIVEGEYGRYCKIEALRTGNATLCVHWTEYDSNGNAVGDDVITRALTVSYAYTSLSFAESGVSMGDGMTAIASKRYASDYTLVDNVYLMKFTAKGRRGEAAPDLSDLVFEASDPSLVRLSTEGGTVSLTVVGDGEVTVSARWIFGEKRNVSPASFTFNAVDGVEIGGVDSVRDPISGAYIDAPTLKQDVARDQLYHAMDVGHKVVLGQNVYLGEDLYARDADGNRVPGSQKYGGSEMLARQLKYLKDLPTTWDWTYQKNLGEAQPTVKYALEITADIYGNGFAVNAEYLTNTLDSTDQPTYSAFKGPLDFVAANKVAAVKGQDNIVFLVRKSGIKIDNISLKGCNDSSIYQEEANGELSMNLSLLKYMGTTLEIMNDATVTNSRVANGRTAVRIYGKDGIALDSPVNAAEERINVTFDNCVIQSAREFLLKIGTNRALRGDLNDPSPYLADGAGAPYKNCNSSACDAYVNDDYFMQNYLLTEVTLKDCTLRDSGLFSIGMESHFAGPALAGAQIASIPTFSGWTGLAATSYPALLRLKGNVVLADWKLLDNVDSSTLIELEANEASNLSFLHLDIRKMLGYVREWGVDCEQYANIIDSVNGKDYVHGGIAFYGGGKNYHMLDLSEYTFSPMSSYNINLSALSDVPPSVDRDANDQGTLLPFAAGGGDFRFVMFDATSQYRYQNQIGA